MSCIRGLLHIHSGPVVRTIFSIFHNPTIVVIANPGKFHSGVGRIVCGEICRNESTLCEFSCFNSHRTIGLEHEVNGLVFVSVRNLEDNMTHFVVVRNIANNIETVEGGTSIRSKDRS